MAGADTGGVRCVGIDGNGAQRLNSQRCGLPGDVAHGLENARSTARVAGLAFGLGGVRDRHGGASDQGASRVKLLFHAGVITGLALGEISPQWSISPISARRL